MITKNYKLSDIFFTYKHKQEKENAIQTILCDSDEFNRSIEIDDYFSTNDIKYIEQEIYKRTR